MAGYTLRLPADIRRVRQGRDAAATGQTDALGRLPLHPAAHAPAGSRDGDDALPRPDVAKRAGDASGGPGGPGSARHLHLPLAPRLRPARTGTGRAGGTGDAGAWRRTSGATSPPPGADGVPHPAEEPDFPRLHGGGPAAQGA